MLHALFFIQKLLLTTTSKENMLIPNEVHVCVCVCVSHLAGSVEIFHVLSEVVKSQEGICIASCTVTQPVTFLQQPPLPNHFSTLQGIAEVLLFAKHLRRQEAFCSAASSSETGTGRTRAYFCQLALLSRSGLSLSHTQTWTRTQWLCLTFKDFWSDKWKEHGHYLSHNWLSPLVNRHRTGHMANSEQ